MAEQTLRMRIQFRRDTTANWTLYKDVVPAAGEPCFDLELGTLKIGDGVKTYEQLDAIGGSGSISVSADGKSIVLTDGVFKLAGFDTAATGAQPRKNADGELEWVVPSTDTVEGLQTTVAALQSDVSSLQTDVSAMKEVLTPSGEGEEPLATRVETLETKMDGTGEGSVDAKITAKINEFATNVTDDGVVNSYKELIDYVANHGGEVATIVADINALQNKVGDSTVSEQISTAMAGIEAGAQANKIESVKVGDNTLEIVDKVVIVPVGAGLTASTEVTISDDGVLGLGQVSVSKLVNDAESTLTLDGGNASE
ncbi:MAG: hypothetical protein ACI4XN_12535 [Candidatus Kurthia intestinigallinarum]